jgi:hypothetical protein
MATHAGVTVSKRMKQTVSIIKLQRIGHMGSRIIKEQMMMLQLQPTTRK